MPDKIKLSRAQIYSRPEHGLDITRQTALDWLKPLAPTWSMVKQGRSGKMSQKEYKRLYIDILKRVNKNTWTLLHNIGFKWKEIIFLCFCPNNSFCHTYLLIDYMADKMPDVYEKSNLDNEQLSLFP